MAFNALSGACGENVSTSLLDAEPSEPLDEGLEAVQERAHHVVERRLHATRDAAAAAAVARVAHDEVHAAGDVPGTKSPDQYTTVFVVSTRASHTAANAKKKEKHSKCGKKREKRRV